MDREKVWIIIFVYDVIVTAWNAVVMVISAVHGITLGVVINGTAMVIAGMIAMYPWRKIRRGH